MKHHDTHLAEPRRRWLAAAVGLPALAWTGAALAQTKAPVVVGWLGNGYRDRRALLIAFTEGMAALGWKLGVTYVLEERHSEGQSERLPALALELAAIKPAVIAAGPSVAVGAANKAAATTPVVVVNGDPLAAGLVKSLARPGGMITGTSTMSSETIQKVIELLVEASPKLQRIAFLVDSAATARDTYVANARRLAARLRVEAVMAELVGPQDIAPAFVRLAKAKVQALVLLPSTWFGSHIPAITGPALAHGWPVVGSFSTIPRLGGLFNYGADAAVLARRAATYVDRILKGAKPGELPIEQPTVFELILNLKTARQLGISIPPSIRLRATEVIE
jgi:putative tryptophan/tyrosine transport system substrate-binding protein